MRSGIAASVALAVWTLSLNTANAQCDWRWRNVDAAADSTVRTFYPWDVDVDGVAELLVGGGFSEIGGVSVEGLVVWDGVAFSEFADAPFLSVHDLIEFRGALNCVGNSALYQWTGTEWDYVESAPFPISALLVHEDNLVAHGPFFRCIQRWDGVNWFNYGLGMSDGYLGDDPSVDDVAIYNGELYACGNFNEADGKQCTTVVRWDGTTWQSLGGAPEPRTTDLLVFDDKLYAGGLSRSPWKQSFGYWDGAAWTHLSVLTGADPDVTALYEFNGRLVLGGTFASPFPRVAFWDGETLSGLGAGLGRTAVFALQEFQGDLYVGGSFRDVEGQPIQYFAIWEQILAGDITGDKLLDLFDLGVLLSAYKTCPGDPAYDDLAGTLADDGNDCVDLGDLGVVLANWGQTCE